MTALDIVAPLALQRAGMRSLEALITVLVLTVGGCLAVECWLAAPTWRSLGDALSPRLDAASIYVAVAILGATVMPHNLYLHSSLADGRVCECSDRDDSGVNRLDADHRVQCLARDPDAGQ